MHRMANSLYEIKEMVNFLPEQNKSVSKVLIIYIKDYINNAHTYEFLISLY